MTARLSRTMEPQPTDPSPPDFLAALRRSELLTGRQFEEVRARVLDGRYPRDPVALTKKLIKKRVLTEFQGRRLLRGDASNLVVGRYVILDRLGRGAMGRVYKARHRLMGRVVALKVIAPEIASRRRVVARFRREMLLVGRLDHPNIVRAFDADQVGHVPYIVMEYVPGQGLDQRLQDHGPLPPAEVIDHATQAALGLAHAHERGVIHRDIKPSNLRVDECGRLKILDFGLGALTELRADDPEMFATADGITVGTIDYMAPEQALGRVVDGRCDLYALGCVMSYLLTGRAPFSAGGRVGRVAQRIGGPPEPLATLRPDLPPGLVEVVEKLMAPRPEDRYQTAAEAAEALRGLASGGEAAPVGAHRHARPAGSRPTSPDSSIGDARDAAPGPWMRRLVHLAERSPMPLVLAASAVLLAAFGLGFLSALLGR